MRIPIDLAAIPPYSTVRVDESGATLIRSYRAATAAEVAELLASAGDVNRILIRRFPDNWKIDIEQAIPTCENLHDAS